MRRATIILGLWIAAAPGRAHADAVDDQALLLARHDLQTARAALEAGKNAEALFVLQEANRLAPSAEVYCAMALALERLGRDADAALRRRACEALSPAAPTVPAPAEPAIATPRAAVAVTAAPPVAATRRPLYQRWWVWTATSFAVASVLVLGLAIGLTPRETPNAQTTFGTWSPF
jgi:hypothetical protein